MRLVKQSTAYNWLVFMTDSADHVTGKTGLTLTITLSKDGGAFSSISPTVTERSNGWYNVALTTSHTDTVGDIAMHVTASGADPTDVVGQVRANVLGDTLPANVTQIGGDSQSATDLKDFADAGYDPSTNKVQGVVLVDTTITNTDMRGTDNAATAASLATHDGKLDTLTTTVGAAGAGLTEAGGDGDHLTAINLPNQTMDITGNITGNLSGSVGSVTGAVGSVTGNVGGNVTGSVGSLATQAKADVNTEVVDALNVDTYAEPGQGTPAATASLVTKIGYLFKAWRNRSTQTSSEYALYADDATTKDQEAAVSDNGTTFERGEITTGA